MIRLVNARLSQVIVLLGFGLIGCAKSDSRAPAKEAPSAAAVAPEPVAEEAPLPPSTASSDRWPQAEAKSGDAPAGAPPKSEPAPIFAPAPRDNKSDGAAKRKEAASPRSAAKPAKGGAIGSEGRSGLDDEAEPALAVSESWTQLNVAFEEMASALALSVPDCGTAERFRQNVCALAERICNLERELPSTTPHNCSDGRSRCSDATSRYNAKCDQ
jgi:type IV secretory pathway VirB10-like protein